MYTAREYRYKYSSGSGRGGVRDWQGIKRSTGTSGMLRGRRESLNGKESVRDAGGSPLQVKLFCAGV